MEISLTVLMGISLALLGYLYLSMFFYDSLLAGILGYLFYIHNSRLLFVFAAPLAAIAFILLIPLVVENGYCLYHSVHWEYLAYVLLQVNVYDLKNDNPHRYYEERSNWIPAIKGKAENGFVIVVFYCAYFSNNIFNNLQMAVQKRQQQKKDSTRFRQPVESTR